jgi:uncharacterized membrane protein
MDGYSGRCYSGRRYSGRGYSEGTYSGLGCSGIGYSGGVGEGDALNSCTIIGGMNNGVKGFPASSG